MHDFYLPQVANRPIQSFFYIILKLTVEKHQYRNWCLVIHAGEMVMTISAAKSVL